jgi:hypothetical protein
MDKPAEGCLVQGNRCSGLGCLWRYSEGPGIQGRLSGLRYPRLKAIRGLDFLLGCIEKNQREAIWQREAGRPKK